ncbi:mitotic checkpoint serine/threonine-protein kinase BUB1-like [Pocillopora damicornis]|uniref:mitotic checkpoint serine/threonine-protein kinase BUB1-like n=1 Tax=Pocillopora damicornis TaxID=46731 RepID=UPI000F550C5B|nr:mitotic checkpoint serine/threonine-protein kinase BUB1-like [Pocillopora damicornis]
MEASSDSSNPNEWELSKENVQPLKQGRKLANLTAAFAPSSVDQSRIHKEKREFEAQIRTYEGEDPLANWYRYIVWTSENFPKGGKDLGSLLERCMTTFKDEERYKNDERYVKVWLRYTDICTDPLEIFNYMHSQQLGNGLALFYEAWALSLENLGDCNKADEVLNLGIHRSAQPLERLQKQHKAFELRLAERVSNGLQQVSITDESELQRTALGGLKGHGKKGTIGTKRTGNATLTKKTGIRGTVTTSNTSNNGFKIFCDNEPGMQSSLPPSTGEWQMPPTEPIIKKENTQKPGKWTDAKVSQKHRASVPINCMPQKPVFSVHVDDDIKSHPPATPQNVLQFDKVLSSRKPDRPSVMDTLRNKVTFKVYVKDVVVEQVGTKKIQGFSKQFIVNANQNRVNGTNTKTTTHLAMSVDVEPMTQGGLAFADQSGAPLPSVQNSTNHEQTSSKPPGSTLASDSQSMYRKSAFQPVTPDVNRSCSFNSSNLAGPSPTVFTKQALMVVGDMFCGPLDSERDLTLGPRQEMDKTEKDFEAAFTGDDTTTVGFSKGLAGMGGFGSSAGFVIYDETVADKRNGDTDDKEKEFEDKENMPPKGNRQEACRRPLAGILQPSLGIPTCSEEDDDEEEAEMNEKFESTNLKNYQPLQQLDKTSEVFLADFTHDQTLASSSFATAAHMASTPFCYTNGPMSLPSLPCSTIRPANEIPELSDLPSDGGQYRSLHPNTVQASNSFISTPSKVLSPIFEASQEDTKSTNSSHSSNGSSRRFSCSVGAQQHNGLELSKIQEETSLCHGDGEQQAVNVGNVAINPFAGAVVDNLLRRINPSLSSYEGFTVSSKEVPRIVSNASVNLGGNEIFNVEKSIGSGAFAKVFLAKKFGDNDDNDFETDDESSVVLKVQEISIEWEFYVSKQLQKRMRECGCSKELQAMFMDPIAAFVYSNSSVLVDKYNPLGTILDMVNKYKMEKKTMEEGVLFYYTIALLRIIETLHSCGIIHGDIKPDNFLVLDSEDTLDCACLKLIDFGRSVDMTLFPAGTTFTTNCYTEDFQCIEMKEGRPWTTQVDMYGLLGTIHCLLFLDYMKVSQDKMGRWKTTKPFKRYWNPIWGRLFDSLLNIPSCEKQPSLKDFREEFEQFYLADEENYSRHRRSHEVFMF